VCARVTYFSHRRIKNKRHFNTMMFQFPIVNVSVYTSYLHSVSLGT